jgi:pilus assembly protein TadC
MPVGVVLLAVLAGVITVGGWLGAALGLVAGLTCVPWLSRRPNPVQFAAQNRFAGELPFAVDLVAAALRAGASPDAAARLVADVVGGDVGHHLRRVARDLRSGATAAEAWTRLGETDAAGRVARAAQRSGESGAALAGSLRRVADDLRSDAVLEAEARARRAGVLVVLPLGLCFLPAFVLTGLVPVIVAVVSGVLSATDPP